MSRSLVSCIVALSLLAFPAIFVPAVHSQTMGPAAAAAKPSVAVILAIRPDGTFQGTGFMAADRLVVTTYHLIGGATRIVVKFPDYPEVEGRLAQADRDNDVAVLSIPALPVRPLVLGDIGQVQGGQTVIVIGYPRMEALGTTSATVTESTVSAVQPPMVRIQTSLSPSYSGAPVLDLQGQVVAIAEATPQGNFATATVINAAKPVLGTAVLAPVSPTPAISAAPAPSMEQPTQSAAGAPRSILEAAVTPLSLSTGASETFYGLHLRLESRSSPWGFDLESLTGSVGAETDDLGWLYVTYRWDVPQGAIRLALGYAGLYGSGSSGGTSLSVSLGSPLIGIEGVSFLPSGISLESGAFDLPSVTATAIGCVSGFGCAIGTGSGAGWMGYVGVRYTPAGSRLTITGGYNLLEFSVSSRPSTSSGPYVGLGIAF